MTNILLLKAKLMELGLTQDQLAEMIGISKASLSYKINNRRDFTISETLKIQKALGLTREERDQIFFAKDVDLGSTELA